MSVLLLLYLLFSQWVAGPTLFLFLLWGGARLWRREVPPSAPERALLWTALGGLGLWLAWGTGAAVLVKGPILQTWLVPLALLFGQAPRS